MLIRVIFGFFYLKTVLKLALIIAIISPISMFLYFAANSYTAAIPSSIVSVSRNYFQKKLDILVSQSIPYKKNYPELDNSVRVLQRLNDEICETILIEKWVLMSSMN